MGQTIRAIKKKIPTPIKENSRPWEFRGEDYSTINRDIIDDILSDEDSYGVSWNGKRIDFNIKEVPFCCGVMELGDFYSLDKDLPQKAFNELMNGLCTKSYTYIINTNGKNSSVRWENFLAKCPSFKKVKSFKNANSGSIISVWVSTN